MGKKVNGSYQSIIFRDSRKKDSSGLFHDTISLYCIVYIRKLGLLDFTDALV